MMMAQAMRNSALAGYTLYTIQPNSAMRGLTGDGSVAPGVESGELGMAQAAGLGLQTS